MGTRVVRAVTDMGVNRGATGSHTVVCDDGKSYVVKFAGRSRTAVNEFLGYELAEAVGLPVPERALVELSEEFVKASSDLRYRSVPAGQHFGSQVVPESFDLTALGRNVSLAEESLANPLDLVGGICHDNWMLTSDRDRPENHLFQPVDGKLRYLLVDFTHGLTGPTWTTETLEQGSYLRTLMPVHPFIADRVSGMSSFEQVLEKVESVDDAEVEKSVSEMPASWGVQPEERSHLVRFFETRRGLLRGVMLSNARRFPNWGR